MANNLYRWITLIACAAALFPPMLLGAMANPPKEDIHFMAEHLAEAAQEARYFALPWSQGGVQPDGWKPVIGIGAADIDAGFASARGGLLSLGATRAWSKQWGVELLAFYDQFDVSGGNSENALTASGVNGVPYDLPQRAEFSNASGSIRHTGVGIIVVRQPLYTGNARVWDYIGGLLLERLELTNYKLNYRLLDGANAGAEGTFDHSGANNLITLFVGAQTIQPIGPRLLLVPRVSVGAPLAAGEFTTRITGPGFDLTTASTGARAGKIGDVFSLPLVLGCATAIPVLRSTSEPRWPFRFTSG
jgi:hypothetical protein